MRFRYTLVAVATLWAIGGCNIADDRTQADRVMNDPVNETEALKPALEVALPAAVVEVMPYDPVHLQPQDQYDIDLRVTYDDGIPRDRTLRLAKSAGLDGEGIEVTLFDEHNSMIACVTQRWGMDGSAVQSSLHESTAFDELAATMRVEGSAVVEFYEINGQAAQFEYIRGEPSEIIAGDDFVEFYHSAPWSPARTLDDNIEGSTMMLLVNDTSFANWMASTIVPAYQMGPAMKPACDAECICGIASVCSYFKCTFGGGWMNFMCDACVGTSLACGIAAIVNNWSDR